MAPEITSEKVSVNINTATLSAIDLLVDAGHYSNRSDFINQALRESITNQQSTIDRLIENRQSAAKRSKNQWFIGISGLTASEIARMDAQGERCEVTGYGLFHLPENADRASLYRVVSAIRVKGRVEAPKDVKEHYGIK